MTVPRARAERARRQRRHDLEGAGAAGVGRHLQGLPGQRPRRWSCRRATRRDRRSRRRPRATSSCRAGRPRPRPRRPRRRLAAQASATRSRSSSVVDARRCHVHRDQAQPARDLWRRPSSGPREGALVDAAGRHRGDGRQGRRRGDDDDHEDAAAAQEQAARPRRCRDLPPRPLPSAGPRAADARAGAGPAGRRAASGPAGWAVGPATGSGAGRASFRTRSVPLATTAGPPRR